MRRWGASVGIVVAAVVTRAFLMRAVPGGRVAKDPRPPCGHLRVSVLTGGGWREAGRLGYRYAPSEGRLDLAELADESGSEISVRIEKLGGGAAHIDRISLDGTAARAASQDLGKLAARDSDVTDVSEGTLQATFDRSGGPCTLEVTARIEPTDIPKEPFQFPRANLMREVNVHSEFYTYAPGDRPGRVTVDGELRGERLGKPFFEEFEPCVSGHPDGVTYGWVMDDGESLYVVIDFTPDNTMDGELDWAKVYARTGEGIREFKVSVKDTDWGRPGFTYTDRAGYQHKVYEFEIPLKEFGSRDRDTGLQLAFAAYGTASAGRPGTMAAFDPVNQRYMMVWAEYTDAVTRNDIYGAVFDKDGVTVAGPFVVAQATEDDAYPGVAANTSAGGFLAVWTWYGSPNYIIRGQRFDADGSTVAGVIDISDDIAGSKYGPAAAYDTANAQWLIVWEDYRSGSSYQVRGQLVAADGTVAGPDFDARGFTNAGQPVPHIEFDSVNTRYLLCMQNPAADAMFISAAGVPDPTTYSFWGGGAMEPNSAFDSATRRFLIAWGGSDIRAALMNGDGTFQVASIDIAVTADSEYQASAAADPATGRFLVSWRNMADDNVYARVVSADGVPEGDLIAVTMGSTTDTEPSVSANVVAHNFGVTYLEDGNPAIRIVAQGTVPAGNGDSGGCAPGGAGTPLALVALGAVVSGLFLRRRVAR